jgi:hypothetical protein
LFLFAYSPRVRSPGLVSDVVGLVLANARLAAEVAVAYSAGHAKM